MAWSRFTWVENVTRAVAARFNNEEGGIEENKIAAATALERVLPTGGTTYQVLEKESNTNYKAKWGNVGTAVSGVECTTSKELILADAGKCIEANSNSTIIITVPPHSSVAWPIGTVIEFTQNGIGKLEIESSGAVVIESPTETQTARAQWSTITLRCFAENRWVLKGDLLVSSPGLPTNAGLNIISGINAGSSKVQIEHAKITGVEAVRCDESQSGGNPTLKQVTTFAHEAGMKICWITFLLTPTSKNEASGKTIIELYNELGSNEKSTLVLIELGNENWPGGNDAGLTGKEYGEKYIAMSKAFREASIPVPLGMQVQTSRVTEAQEWMTSLGTVSHSELTEALKPRGILPSGNWIVSHPYYGRMNLAQKSQNLLIGSPEAYLDTESNFWGSQRWMKQQAQVKEWTGLTVPMAITEYGAAAAVKHSGVPNRVFKGGGWVEVGEYITAFWGFMRKVQRGEVTTAPTNLIPVIALACWYDMDNNESFGGEEIETYGILEAETSTPNEQGSVFKLFKEGVEAL